MENNHFPHILAIIGKRTLNLSQVVPFLIAGHIIIIKQYLIFKFTVGAEKLHTQVNRTDIGSLGMHNTRRSTL